MKGSINTVGLLLVLLAGTANAGDAREITVPDDAAMFGSVAAQPYVLARNDVVLAQNGAGSNAAQNVASATPPKVTEFKEPIFSLNKAHEYLGISTIIAAGLTMVTAPGEGCETNCPPPSQQPPRQTNGTHANLAKATVALAAASIATGIAAHWDDIHWDNGITDPDNMHAMLGLLGAGLMAAAVNKSAKSTVQVSHAGQAELGAALMVVGIKLVW